MYLSLASALSVTLAQPFSHTCLHLLPLQVGDSIVHKARETLERAIKLVNDTKKWGAHVVYGDTDR